MHYCEEIEPHVKLRIGFVISHVILGQCMLSLKHAARYATCNDRKYTSLVVARERMESDTGMIASKLLGTHLSVHS